MRKVCVLRIEGTNCEDEMAAAFEMVGHETEKVHLKQLIGDCPKDLERNLMDYDVLALPGGFSAGDYIRAGAIFAARIRSAIGEDVSSFVDDGRPVIGVCNGFQILVELGLLPASAGVTTVPEAALYVNDSGRFECRPTMLRMDNHGSCLWTSRIAKGDVVMFPSAHAEGHLLFPKGKEADVIRTLEDNDQIVFRYVDADGNEPEYPWNPNGSISDIAGICNPDGNVIGMMPHPERAMTRFNHPDWTRGYDNEDGDGLKLFQSIV